MGRYDELLSAHPKTNSIYNGKVSAISHILTSIFSLEPPQVGDGHNATNETLEGAAWSQRVSESLQPLDNHLALVCLFVADMKIRRKGPAYDKDGQTAHDRRYDTRPVERRILGPEDK